MTPWLRTARRRRFRLFADSASLGRGDTVHVERRQTGRWVRLPEDSDRAFGFAGGSRAVVEDRLYQETGPPVPLGCAGELRATPDDVELVCVEIHGRFAADGTPQTACIVRMDRDGQVIGRREVVLPVLVPDPEPALGRRVSTSFLGFLPEGLVFSVLESAAHESFASGSAKRARAFLLRADGSWCELGTLTFTVEELWKLHFPRPWNEALGWEVEEGARPRDTFGEPRP